MSNDRDSATEIPDLEPQRSTHVSERVLRFLRRLGFGTGERDD
jgi:hypothetical protein